MNVIVYSRTGHEDGPAMPIQVDMLKTYCGKRGYTVSRVVTECCSERNVGRQLNVLLDSYGAKEIDAIVAWNYSCISRDHVKLLGFMRALEARRMLLITLDEEVVEPASALWELICKNKNKYKFLVFT